MRISVYSLCEAYEDFLEKGDPRMKTWPLMASPIPALWISLGYFAFVIYGPRYMADRKPMELKYALQIYNLCMVCLSMFISATVVMNVPSWETFYRCVGVDVSNDPKSLALTMAGWTFFVSKFIEYLDTVFIILRKKTSHLTFLHVIHHGILPLAWWFGIKFSPGGAGVFHVLVNAVVHTIMYSYYFLASCGPEVQKYLWWKKYITKIQITQFVITMVHSVVMLTTPKCDYPRIFLYMILFFEFLFFVLFMNFYLKTYTMGRKTGMEKSDRKIKIKEF